MIAKLLNLQFIKYGIVGVLSVIIDYALIYVCYELLIFNETLSVAIGFIGSSIINYLLHKYYTFYDPEFTKHSKSVLKYIILITGSFFITIFLVNQFMVLGLNIYLAKFLTLVIVYIYGFLIGKYFVFKA